MDKQRMKRVLGMFVINVFIFGVFSILSEIIVLFAKTPFWQCIGWFGLVTGVLFGTFMLAIIRGINHFILKMIGIWILLSIVSYLLSRYTGSSLTTELKLVFSITWIVGTILGMSYSPEFEEKTDQKSNQPVTESGRVILKVINGGKK